ncbi:anillin-like isoform X2 [Penaeus japonicus]|uniref:anillin-like isoform X2 n=1 Tax=Penaeus japonicus TaxID=27405 RepID=UPI001C711E5B|nr:anillin-like isoform X2 [Penaeus japonicus]
MADPFVQRMMARSQARRAGLNKNLGDVTNKENVSMSGNTRSRLKQINSMYSDEGQPSEPAMPLQPANSETEYKMPKKQSSPRKPSSSSLDLGGDGADYPTPSTESASEGPLSPPRRTGLTALARRCQQLREWEDDYTYHSTNHGSQVVVEGSPAFSASQVHGQNKNMHDPNPCRKGAVHAAKSQAVGCTVSSSGLQSPVCSSDVAANLDTVPKYFFGDGPAGMVQGNGGGSQAVSAALSMTPSSNITSSQSKHASKSELSRAKQAFSQTESPASPTKKLNWDRGLLNSLEAQGFTPTESRSRLYYDFKKEEKVKRDLSPPKKQVQKTQDGVGSSSPTKTKGMSLADLVMSSSPTKVRSPLKESLSTTSACLNATKSATSSVPAPPPLPPVVVSCLPKSPCSSPAKQFSCVSSPRQNSRKEHSRDLSPSKVGEMRSRWEQHIRDASPERQDRSRSPQKIMSRSISPRKLPPAQTASPVRSRSPVKSTSSLDMNTPVGAMAFSPHRMNSQEEGQLNRFSSERRSRRDLSPHKPPPVGDVVKGEAPMPEVVPLIEEPHMSSVRQRAAAFDSAGGSREPEKDPAELTLQERRALFNKKQAAALVPKAPFGQSVPAKNLQSEAAGPAATKATSVAHSQPVKRPSKRIATEPAPGISQKLQEIQKGNQSPNTFDSQRKHFENIKDNWRENEISNKVRLERQKEMDLLMNRFKKPARPQVDAKTVPVSHSNVHERSRDPEESETEYAESEESYAESTTSEDTCIRSAPAGPPKPPRLYLESSSSTSSGPFTSPKVPLSPAKDIPGGYRCSPPTRLNSTEIEEVPVSPKKEYVPRIKPGCLFPSLSDIESQSEAVDSQDEEDFADSSFAESILTCTSMESLGQKIQQAAHTGITKQLSTIAERTEINNSHYDYETGMSASTMEAVAAIDDAIDEALDDEPTPPKRLRPQEEMLTSTYKTPRLNHDSPSEDCENTLAHSLSMYRKQKPEVTYTPVRQIVRRPDLRSPTPEPAVSPSVTVSARIRELQEEVEEQQRVISQASNAITVVLQRVEQQGTPQHVEAEKLLLLASQKRQTALNEIQRLKTEGAMAQRSWPGDEDCCQGSISISKISVPLKQDFIKKGISGDTIYHLMVLVKHRDQVISSQLLTTPECVVDGSVTFPNLMSLHHLTSDFNIALEVYALSTIQQRNLSIKKEQSRMKLTPLKRLQKNDSRLASPSVQSPGGPFAVRSSSFQLVGFTHLNISTLTRNAWTLEKVPFSSPLDGHLLMNVSCSFEGGITERGFLTMFEDVGGFGAWNRRWCVLSGMHLRYWRYPDDETKKDAIGQIDLRRCTTRRVELVARDVCARQHTFQLTCMRPAYSGDINNLVQEIHGSALITKLLLSADSKEERIVWCNKLNKALANIRAWDPDALRPEDYQV